MGVSEELAALCKRADLATTEARRLLNDNRRWQLSILQQLDAIFDADLVSERRVGRRPTHVS